VGELNVSNASRATHRKPNNANHRRSLSLSLSFKRARARERERAFTSALGGKTERQTDEKREKEREIFGKISQNGEREPAISLALERFD
jgi:hypothetical protein